MHDDDVVEKAEMDAKVLGWTFTRLPGETLDQSSGVTLGIPNGRQTRSIDISVAALAHLQQIGFQPTTFLGNYQAINLLADNTLEARIAPVATGGLRMPVDTALSRIPGTERLQDVEVSMPQESGDIETYRVAKYRLLLNEGGLSLEISPTSPYLSLLLRQTETADAYGTSLKIRGLTTGTHDEALELLERYAYSFLFDFDIRFGVSLEMLVQRNNKRRKLRERSTETPNFPRNDYALEPLSLYRYGRSAANLPLLQFLAFYQVLEFFFSYYAREEVLRRLRSKLTHPRFNARSSSDLNQIVNIAEARGRRGSEREQLRATIQACVEPDSLQAFIKEPSRLGHFSNRKQGIRGLKPLDLSGPSLQDQVADRIYALRCRIVHTKEESGDGFSDALLPFSQEVTLLGPEIELVQLVAQNALIDRAEPLN